MLRRGPRGSSRRPTGPRRPRTPRHSPRQATDGQRRSPRGRPTQSRPRQPLPRKRPRRRRFPTSPMRRGSSEDLDTEPEAPRARSHGFRVYRRLATLPYGVPLNYEPQEKRLLTDTNVPLGTSVCYVIRAVGSTEPLVESAASNEMCLDVRDISPPASPHRSGRRAEGRGPRGRLEPLLRERPGRVSDLPRRR